MARGLGGANNMRPLTWGGGGGAQTKKIHFWSHYKTTRPLSATEVCLTPAFLLEDSDLAEWASSNKKMRNKTNNSRSLIGYF